MDANRRRAGGKAVHLSLDLLALAVHAAPTADAVPGPITVPTGPPGKCLTMMPLPGTAGHLCDCAPRH